MTARGRTPTPCPGGPGAGHVAFHVDDFEAVLDKAVVHGARMLGRPIAFPGGRSVYLAAPGGAFSRSNISSRRAHDHQSQPSIAESTEARHHAARLGSRRPELQHFQRVTARCRRCAPTVNTGYTSIIRFRSTGNSGRTDSCPPAAGLSAPPAAACPSEMEPNRSSPHAAPPRSASPDRHGARAFKKPSRIQEP